MASYTVNLTAYPAARGPDFMQSTFDFGDVPARQTVTVPKLIAIADAVKAFGATVAEANPGRSFLVSVRMTHRTDRKPPGFDAATNDGRSDPLGLLAWVKTGTTRPEAEALLRGGPLTMKRAVAA